MFTGLVGVSAVSEKNFTVSAIIPTYNRADCVFEALDSILAQKSDPCEIIVVDDGSTDRTPELLTPYESSIKIIRQTHQGVSAARNAGICAATAQWIAFLDSDDLWLPDKILRQLEFFEINPDYKICQTEEIWLRDGWRINPRKYHAKPQGHCFSSLLDRCLISPSAVMVHREVFQKVGLFDETLPACEDYDLWLRIGYRYPIGLVREPLVIKRGGRSDQLSMNIPALDRFRIESLVKLLRNEPLEPMQREIALEVLAKKCRIYGLGCRKRGRFEEAVYYFHLPDAFHSSPISTQPFGFTRKQDHPLKGLSWDENQVVNQERTSCEKRAGYGVK